MQSPQYLRNGEAPQQQRLPPQFHSTVSVQKLRRFNTLILVFRFASFCFCLSSTIFMYTNSRGSHFPNWTDFQAFRYVLAANAIVTLYSFAQMVISVWEILTGSTVLPETLQVWFDFGHDQVFAYMLVSANAAGTTIAWTLNGQNTCTASNAFCIQSYIAIAFGFAGFLFLGFCCLLSGFRAVCLIIHGYRFLIL